MNSTSNLPASAAPTLLNLVPFGRVEQRRARRRVLVWTGICIAYALLIGASALVVHGPAARSLQDVRRAARAATSEAELAAAKREETMKKVASKLRLLEASNTVGLHPDWSVLLSALADIRGDSIVLTTLELEETPDASLRPAASAAAPRAAAPAGRASGQAAAPATPGPQRRDSFRLRLLGMGLTHTDVMAFVARLEDLGPLRGVSVVDARTGKVGAGEVTSFELTCQISDQPENGGSR